MKQIGTKRVWVNLYQMENGEIDTSIVTSFTEEQAYSKMLKRVSYPISKYIGTFPIDIPFYEQDRWYNSLKFWQWFQDKHKKKFKLTEKQINMSAFTPTQEEIDNLNKIQSERLFHPLTCCCGNGEPNCKRSLAYKERAEGKDIPYSKENEGVLIATKQGWVCPCGKYTQPYHTSDTI